MCVCVFVCVCGACVCVCKLEQMHRSCQKSSKNRVVGWMEGSPSPVGVYILNTSTTPPKKDCAIVHTPESLSYASHNVHDPTARHRCVDVGTPIRI